LSPISSSILSFSRFCQFLQALHFSDNDTTNYSENRMLKLGNVMTVVLKNFQNLILAGKNLAVDESLLKFKGRLLFRQYIPTKRARFGIKFFIISDSSTNFIINMIPYQGKKTQISEELVKNFGYGGAVVLSLMDPYLNSNRIVFIDNYFSSPKLTKELFEKKTGVVGTVRKNRKGMPHMAGKLKAGDIQVFSCHFMMVER